MIFTLQIVILVLAEALLIGMSVAIGRDFSHHQRLPMQWQFDGTVTATAPRRVALAFTPVVSALVFLTILVLSFLTDVRAGQEWLLLCVTIVVSLGMAGAHAFHLRLMRKALRD